MSDAATITFPDLSGYEGTGGTGIFWDTANVMVTFATYVNDTEYYHLNGWDSRVHSLNVAINQVGRLREAGLIPINSRVEIRIVEASESRPSR